MSSKVDLLIGKIALREGLISKEQLYDSLIAQERDPSRTLGQIMIQRGYLDTSALERLLEIQRQAFEHLEGATSQTRSSGILGRLLIEKRLATDYQVNDALRLQAQMADMGISPIPPLGEIMIKRGYITKDTLEKALQLQNLALYTCPECYNPIEFESLLEESPQEAYRCTKCRVELPFLYAKMVTNAQAALRETIQKLESNVPDEVKLAEQDTKNHFGKYILVREMGRGGSGIVYKAWQKDLKKMVALKILLKETDTAAGVRTPFGDVEDVKRFYHEIHAAAQLSHPNIVPIYDFDIVGDDVFFTMEFIEGVTLDTLLVKGFDEHTFASTIRADLKTYFDEKNQRRQAKLHRILLIIQEIAQALDYAHERGVYHRDVKPQNIIIDKTGKPWIMDFGLAKEVKLADSAYVKGVVVGTPVYMSPEQAQGDMEQMNNQSDIYSLGAVLYEMLTGQVPFDGKNSEEILGKVICDPLIPPSHFDPLILKPVEAICLKALEKEHQNRYRRAHEMAGDIQCFFESKPLRYATRRGEAKESAFSRFFDKLNPFKK